MTQGARRSIRLQGSSINSFLRRIALLRSTRNPHVLYVRMYAPVSVCCAPRTSSAHSVLIEVPYNFLVAGLTALGLTALGLRLICRIL